MKVKRADNQEDNQTEKEVKQVVVKKEPVNEIWEQIKNVKLDLFALPNQKVQDHFKVKVANIPGMLQLDLPVATSKVAALEEALKDRFNIEIATKYVIVTKRTDVE